MASVSARAGYFATSPAATMRRIEAHFDFEIVADVEAHPPGPHGE